VFYIVMADCLEPVHVHVRAGNDARAKFWLVPHVELGTARGYDRTQLGMIERLVSDHRETLLKRWDETCFEDAHQ
jgi:hypothetical protein